MGKFHKIVWVFHIPLFPPSICTFLHSLYVPLQLWVWCMRFFWRHFIQCAYLNISNEQFRSYPETSWPSETHEQCNASWLLAVQQTPQAQVARISSARSGLRVGSWSLQWNAEGRVCLAKMGCHSLLLFFKRRCFLLRIPLDTDSCSPLCSGVKGKATCGRGGSSILLRKSFYRALSRWQT